MYQKKEEKPISRPVSDNRYNTKDKNNSKTITTANKTNINKFVVRYILFMPNLLLVLVFKNKCMDCVKIIDDIP